jgi:hypothetical protein
MGLIDTTFASLPTQLLADWGTNVTYIKAGTTETYNPVTGAVTSTETSLTVRAYIGKIEPKEFEGFYQTTDIKVIIGTSELGTYYPTVRDRIQYTETGVTKVGRIIDIQTYRGDNPVLHTLIVRPQ